MTTIYLIHGWGGSPTTEGWFGWFKKECDERNIKLVIPEMPDTNFPKIEEWVGKLKEVVELDESGNFKDDVYFVGHSMGSQASMRFLEKYSGSKKANGLIFVAGFVTLIDGSLANDEEMETAKPWLENRIDFEKVKNNVGKVLAIFSDNDPYVPVTDSETFKDQLDAEIIIKENENHFNETLEIPEIMEFIDSDEKVNKEISR